MKYKWMNGFTGEVHKTLMGAIITSIRDMFYYPECRHINNFEFVRLRKEMR